MKRLMIPAVILITAFILAVGFFLPQYVLGFRDKQTIGKLDITDGRISFEAKSELGIIDRLKMITNAASIPLDNGKNMDPDTAYQRALTEIGKFNSKSILEFDLSSCKMVRNSVSFYIDSADPTKNIIVWYISIEDDSHFITVAVDDATGILLSVDYSSDTSAIQYKSDMIARPSAAPLTDLSVLADSIADYYGLTVSELTPEKNSKFSPTNIMSVVLPIRAVASTIPPHLPSSLLRAHPLLTPSHMTRSNSCQPNHGADPTRPSITGQAAVSSQKFRAGRIRSKILILQKN